MLKALIFDFNGVLVNDVPYHLEAYKQAFELAGAHFSKEEIKEMIGKPTSEVIRQGLEKHKSKVDYKKITEKKIAIYKKLIVGKKLLFPKEETILEELKKKARLGIFSASPRNQIVFPEKLLGLFEIIVAGEETKAPKPEPNTLLMIAEKLEAKPAECAYVGDFPVDMQTAKNANMLAIGITASGFTKQELKKSGADKVINSLKELLELKV
ncbi:MAG: HAD family hydrolase [Candidatus ainarchaeum sp.]|nr:HAD family hydrolase [Candidatus ainarchaeum sp.]